MDNIETFHSEKIVVAERVGFILEADSFKSVQIIRALYVMDNIDTFHYKKIVAAENVGFIFEADLVKTAPTFLGSGCHGQH